MSATKTVTKHVLACLIEFYEEDASPLTQAPAKHQRYLSTLAALRELQRLRLAPEPAPPTNARSTDAEFLRWIADVALLSDENATRLRAVADALKQPDEPAGRWISVKDRMPERFEVCIVAYDSDCDGKTRVCEGEIVWIGSGWYVGQTDQPYTGHVTHWQPWPKFPETKSADAERCKDGDGNVSHDFIGGRCIRCNAPNGGEKL